MGGAEARPTGTLARMAAAVAGAAADGFKPRIGGRVVEATLSSCRISGLEALAQLGSSVALTAGGKTIPGEVVRIDASAVTVTPFDSTVNIGLGQIAWLSPPLSIRPSIAWKGRVINALAQPIDRADPLPQGDHARAIDMPAPEAMRRQRVGGRVPTGVRVIDVFTPLCLGQRMGIFAGSGVGKSTLLSMLVRSEAFDSVVVALVGERGREVREFVEDALGSALARAVVVASTGDESPMMRRLSPRTAMAIAEHFREAGENVLLLMDSVTRYAHACRDVALTAGEPPVSRGYPPSVFSELPRLLERAGPGPQGKGSITALFSVLVDGDDHNDPVADCIRGTLDGHIVLDRAIADQGRYPAVNILTSVSRLAGDLWSEEQRKFVRMLRSLVARFEETRDLRAMGGYQAGLDPELDQAVQLAPRLYHALAQDPRAPASRDAFRDLATMMTAPQAA